MDLTKIKDPSFLKGLTEKELNDLAVDIRQFIIQSVSQTGGHLSSNLGIVGTHQLHYIMFLIHLKIKYFLMLVINVMFIRF